MYKIQHKQVDEVNMLFEMIKPFSSPDFLLRKLKNSSKPHTHYEIRCGHYEGGKFVVNNIVTHDAEFLRQLDDKY